LDEEAARLLDEQSGTLKSGALSPDNDVKASTGWSGGSQADRVKSKFLPNSGGASRFFYCAKASKSERNAGLADGATCTHPTVKPIKLMRYLCKLITPPGGTVLDPFMGSGTTGVACVQTGRNFIGCEIDPKYFAVAERRIKQAEQQPALWREAQQSVNPTRAGVAPQFENFE
jgi:site-specific DNA-methyltransferase (adenine-specific)